MVTQPSELEQLALALKRAKAAERDAWAEHSKYERLAREASVKAIALSPKVREAREALDKYIDGEDQ